MNPKEVGAVCVCAYACIQDLNLCIGFRLLRDLNHFSASLHKASWYPNCSPRTPVQLVFFMFIIFPSSLTFQLPYFVILWSAAGGNFCAGYDLKELANHAASLKLEQDVTKGPGPMVSALGSVCVLVRVLSIFPKMLGRAHGFHRGSFGLGNDVESVGCPNNYRVCMCGACAESPGCWHCAIAWHRLRIITQMLNVEL